MSLLAALVPMLLFVGVAGDETVTRMVVVDEGSRTAYRAEVPLDLSLTSLTQYSVPQLISFTSVDYDYLEDRLYILYMHYRFKSVFLNGTDSRNIKDIGGSVHSLAVDPHARLIFYSVYNSGLFSMNMDGTDPRLLINRTMYANEMAVDYQRQMLYWSEHGTDCSCLFRIGYDGQNFETFSRIHMSKGAHAVDFDTETLYGHGPRGLHKYQLSTGQEKTWRQPVRHWATQTVFDPNTHRLFITNYDVSDNVHVYTTNGSYVGKLEGLSLTKNKYKLVRINPM